MPLDSSRIVATGVWLYAGEIPCRVFIQQEDIWPAFFDLEDDPDVGDKITPCVSVWFENPSGGFTFAPNRYFRNVEEAKEAIEKLLPNHIKWDP